MKQHKSQFSELLARTRRRLQEQRETPEYPASIAPNGSGATECQQTEPVCFDSDTTLCSSPVVTGGCTLADSDDSEHMVSDWELCDDRASPRKDVTSSDDDDSDSDPVISDESLCVRKFKDVTSSDDDEPAKNISDGSLCSSLCKDDISSDDDRPIKPASETWALCSSPDITSSDDDQPLKTSADAEITKLNISRDRDDGDADSDATVDDGVGIEADDEQEREMMSDEMTLHQTEEVRGGVKRDGICVTMKMDMPIANDRPVTWLEKKESMEYSSCLHNYCLWFIVWR